MADSLIEFDYAVFKRQIPKYKDLTEAYVNQFWDIAILFMSNADYGWLRGAKRQLGLNYLTAHLIYDQNLLDAGRTFTVNKSAQIDKIQVDGALPPSPDNYTWELNTSPYGQFFMLLLKSYTAGGLYVGPETDCGRSSRFRC